MHKLKSIGKKLIIILIIIITIFMNFPIGVFAAERESKNGGPLLYPLAKFTTFLCDCVMQFLQDRLVSTDKIEYEEGKFDFKYSPAVIFSGEVPAFDINFIKPDDDKVSGPGINGNQFEEFIDSANIKPIIIVNNVNDEAENIAKAIRGEFCAGGERTTSKESYENLIDELISNLKSEWDNGPVFKAEISVSANLGINNIYTVTIKKITGEDEKWELISFKKTNTYDSGEIEYIKNGEKIEFNIGSYEEMEVSFDNTVKNKLTSVLIEVPESNSDLDESNFVNVMKNIDQSIIDSSGTSVTVTHQCRGYATSNEVIIRKSGKQYEIYVLLSGAEITQEVYESTAKILQGTIATWYNALRKISLVGLLSVLVYIGIKIVLLGVEGKGNAKYKRMLTDWIVAILLLFSLQYIMSFILVITQTICNVFNIEGTSDVLLNTIRGNIFKAQDWEEVIADVVLYTALTIFTVIFTIQYIKRVIYMAFFTLIAPLITLTYPIDKINDGKAQAFGMWLKEYIFNCMIQVAHLVIYFTLVSSALSLAQKYPLYAVIAIGMITPAEKIIRKMFGFNNASTVGTLQAAATGGLVASAMGQLSKVTKPKKDSKDENSKQVRTKNTDPLGGLRTANNSEAAVANSQVRQASTQGNVNESQDINTQRAEAFRRLMNSGMSQEEALNQINREHPFPEEKDESKRKISSFKRVGKGVWHLAKPILSGAAEVAAGTAGATIGFAAGVAQGDVGKAFTGLTGGAAAGYYGASKVIDAGTKSLKGVPKTIKKINNTFNKEDDDNNNK